MKTQVLAIIIMTSLSLNASAMFANTEAKVYDASIFTGMTHNVRGEFEYGIQNNTFYPQDYLISYSLCADDKGCVTEKIKISLASTQREQKKLYAELPIIYRHPGVYRITGSIKIDGESSHAKEVYGTLKVQRR